MIHARLLMLLISLLCVAPIFTAHAYAAEQLVAFCSPPAGGGGYVLVVGMVNTVNKYMPAGAKLVHEATTGTLEMVRRLQNAYSQKKPMLADFGTPDGWNAYKGEAEYKGRPFSELRSISFNQLVDLYLVVPANSPIKSYADLKGKRISMGGAGSTVSTLGYLTLDHYGVTKKDFKPYYFVYKETIEGIGDGSLDGGFFAGGYPMASYMELSTTKNVRIVPVDDTIGKRLVAEHPGHIQGMVKAKSYRGIEQDTPIVGWTGAIWTHAGTSPEIVYNFTKTLFEHKEEYYQIHRDARALTVEDATKTIRVPFHPGAERYLREVGAIM